LSGGVVKKIKNPTADRRAQGSEGPSAAAAAGLPNYRGKGQGAPQKKNQKKATYLPTYLPFLRFFEIFRSDFRKYFYGVLKLLMQRNGQKCYKKNRWEKTEGTKFFFLNFFGQKFLTWTSPKKFFVVFLNSP
jgi:hypothetical protein